MQAGTVFRRRPQYDRKTAAVRRPAVARLTAAVAYGGSADFGCNGIVQDKKRFEVFPFREMSLHSPCSICTSERNPSHLISKIQFGSSKGCSVMDASIGVMEVGMARFAAPSKSFTTADAESLDHPSAADDVNFGPANGFDPEIMWGFIRS